jgi:acylphosphatase
MHNPAQPSNPTDAGQAMAIHLTIRGRAQGVGYRMAPQTTAQHLQLQGWVRNRRNGDVEAWVQGPHCTGSTCRETVA